MYSPMVIAIVGAGMAGLTCAKRLTENGHRVSVFDKGRGPGGRMASRRADIGTQTFVFDHGAQYFTVTDPRFAHQVAEWQQHGTVAPWPAAGDECFVGTPAMNAPIRAMSKEMDVQFCVRVEALRRSGSGWQLEGEGVPQKPFDAVIVSLPAEQAAPLLSPHSSMMAEVARTTRSDPCWTVMAAFDGKVDHADIVRDAGPIGWAARNSAKPDRGDAECWVIQASARWSRDNIEEERDAVATLLLESFRNQIGGDLPGLIHSAAHRWLYSKSGNAGKNALWNEDLRLGVCGDWLLGPRIESAFISGHELADRV